MLYIQFSHMLVLPQIISLAMFWVRCKKAIDEIAERFSFDSSIEA
jgi:hypothetical protein